MMPAPAPAPGECDGSYLVSGATEPWLRSLVCWPAPPDPYGEGELGSAPDTEPAEPPPELGAEPEPAEDAAEP